MKTFKEWLKEYQQDLKTITVTCSDPDDKLEALLNHIKTSGNVGHSFSIIVDPEGDDTKKFYWDGDGSDYIRDIKSSVRADETMTSTSCVASFARPSLPMRHREWPVEDEFFNKKKKKKS